jgi:transposase-like protein
MRRKRRNYSPAFKAKVALAALQGEKTLAELSRERDVHVNQIQTWRNQLKTNIASLFDFGIDQRKDNDALIKLLQAKIGQLTMENNFLPRCSNHESDRAQGQNRFDSWLADHSPVSTIIDQPLQCVLSDKSAQRQRTEPDATD